MPGEMQYDILTHADAEICHCDSAGMSKKNSESEGEAMGVFGADWFIYSAAYCLCLFVQLHMANATQASQRISVQLHAKSHRFQGLSGLHYEHFSQTWPPSFLDSLLSARHLFLFFILSSRLFSLPS